jgi:YVTN family beta-propeller protein
MKKLLFIIAIVLFANVGNAQTAYAANSSGTITVIDVSTNTIIDTISVGAPITGVSASSDGTKVYVTNFYSHRLKVINTATNTVSATILVGAQPWGITVSQDGSKVYVSNDSSSIVSVIDAATNIVTATIHVGALPHGIAVSPDGSRVYTANHLYGSITVINTATNMVSATISNIYNAFDAVISPDGSKLYVSCSNNFGGNVVYGINTATNTVTDTIVTGNGVSGLSISPDGSKLYTGNTIDSTISVINTATNLAVATIPIGASPAGISVSPDGSKVYVCSSGGVRVINAITNTLSATIPTGIFSANTSYGNFISIFNPNCFAHYTTSYDSTQHNFTLNVDSITSALATSYHWDFGDGTTSTLATPSHTYAVDTLYNVCMKIYTAAGDSCSYCHIIGFDSLGNVVRTAGFTINVNNNTTVLVPTISKENTLTISPNPFSCSTTISFSSEQKNTTITITDVLGKQIKSVILSGARNFTIEKGTMSNGIYFLQITDENKNVINKKLIVQ